MYDLLIRGARVMDGSGNPWFYADVAVQDGKIAAVERAIKGDARRTIDAEGLIVSPGWVDVHSHSDFSLLLHPHADSLLIQGATLTITGNCGISAAPLKGVALEESQVNFKSGTQAPALEGPQPVIDWSSFDEYLCRLERQGVSMNVACLVGHSTVRLSVMGHAQRKANAEEIAAMQSLVEESMQAGAFGMSTGLVYWPGCWSDTEEIVSLAQVVAGYGGIYASHIRGERETNIAATIEAIEIGKRARIPVHISHMQSKFPAYGRAEEKLRLLEAARDEGVDIACDTDAFPWIYYEARAVLPLWPFKADPGKFHAMLKDPASRERLKREMRSIDPLDIIGRTGEGGIYQQRAWDRVWVYECRSDPSVETKTIAEISEERQVEPEDALFDLILSEGGEGPYVFVAHIEDDHKITARHPLCIFPSTDGEAVELAKIPPRFMQYSQEWLSMFPRVISRYVREEGLMSMEEAIRRMTSYPCQRFNIRRRGLVREGMWADLTIFDPERIQGRGSYQNPLERPAGIAYVIVNGNIAVEGGQYTGNQAGRVLRRGRD